MRRKLEHNPIGWLEQRSWSGRLVTWGWLGVVTCLYCAALTGSTSFQGIGQVHGLVGWLLGGSMALTAAGSFRRERETGVLELLLVSPLRVQEIISGRLRGLWSQFLPAIGLLVAVQLYLGSIFNYGAFIQQSQSGAVFLQACSFLSVPVIGLYFSLRCRNFMSALLATVTVALVIPVAASAILGWLFWSLSFGPPSNLTLYGYAGPAGLSFSGYGGPGFYLYRLATLSTGYAAVSQLLLAALCWNRLLWRLKLRQFPFDPTAH
jgi:ABC-type transport system involved in multi-copper enzyme maturation permease subunit